MEQGSIRTRITGMKEIQNKPLSYFHIVYKIGTLFDHKTLITKQMHFMTKKLLSVCLFMTLLFFFSCEKENTQMKSGISIETISIITVVTMGVAILVAYSFKRR